MESGLQIFEQSSSNAVHFNELDVLQLIPVIIKKLKVHSINEEDQTLLKTIYGVLWQLITEEAERTDSESMNPVLKELLNAQQIQLQKRENRQYENDVEHNTVQRVAREKIQKRKPVPAAAAMRLMKLKMRRDVSPAQRLLKFSALLIHESVVRKQQQQQEQREQQLKSPRKLRIHKKQLSHNMATVAMPTINKADRSDDDTVVLDIHLNRVNKPTRRFRRDTGVDGDNDDEDEEDRNEIEMNLLRSMIGPEDDGEDDEDDLDAVSGEQNVATRTYNVKEKSAYASAQSDGNKEYMDYAFDVSDNDVSGEEEQLLRSFYAPRTLSSSFDDYEYGSFSELMQLAAKHHSRAQRDSNYLKRLHVDDYLNDEMEY